MSRSVSLRSFFSKDRTMILFFAVLCIILTQVHTGFEYTLRGHEVFRHRARITAVDNRDMDTFGITHTGSQRMQAVLLSGPCKGMTVRVDNQLLGKLELDEIYASGEDVLVQYSVRDGKPNAGVARGHYRVHYEIDLLVLFALLLLVVAGWTGLKALLSFIFSALMIWKVLIPLFLKGWSPVPTGLAIAAILTATISFLVGGLTRKGLITFLGAFLGLVLTAGMAVLFSQWFRIHGAVRPYAETLLYSGFYYLKLTPIFIACIFIASSGAVMDLAMDISAAMDEIKAKHPQIHYWEHVRSGMRVGRSVIGTMTTTLLLAYSSSYIFMLMLFVSKNIPLLQVFNLNYVAAEVLNTLVGSFGLVTVAPFTALVGGLVYKGRKDSAIKFGE
jgi:uncharacterized membrane protein